MYSDSIHLGQQSNKACSGAVFGYKSMDMAIVMVHNILINGYGYCIQLFSLIPLLLFVNSSTCYVMRNTDANHRNLLGHFH